MCLHLCVESVKQYLDPMSSWHEAGGCLHENVSTVLNGQESAILVVVIALGGLSQNGAMAKHVGVPSKNKSSSSGAAWRHRITPDTRLLSKICEYIFPLDEPMGISIVWLS